MTDLKDDHFPPDYYELVRQMSLAAKFFVASKQGRPEFQFPPSDIIPIGYAEDLIENFCLNADARFLAAVFITLAASPQKTPTLYQVRCALEHAGIAWKECSLKEFSRGFVAVGGGGDA